MHQRSRGVVQTLVGVIVAILLTGVGAVTTTARAHAQEDFYTYTGAQPLSSLPAGAVLKTRTIPYHLLGVATQVDVVQILYRSTDAMGRAVGNVTSVVKPPNPSGPTKLVSFQSQYDSANVTDSPSRLIAGDGQIGGFTPSGRNFGIGFAIPSGETALFGPLVAAGYTVNVPDVQGSKPVLFVGPEYARLTLDSLRAARNVAATGITDTSKIGMFGYSGGSVATNWAAIEAPTYAPEINKNLVGAAMGGVITSPANSMRYVDGSALWAGISPLYVLGFARAYDFDLKPYLNDYGRAVLVRAQDAALNNFFAQMPFLKWSDLALPQYANANSIPELVAAFNKSDMNQAPAPTVPTFFGQGANGVLEGTQDGEPGIGAGDGVAVAGDVRTLANRYCAAGLPVQYDEYHVLSHVATVPVWLPGVYQWLAGRFAGEPAPSNCGSIAPGNVPGPELVVPPAPIR